MNDAAEAEEWKEGKIEGTSAPNFEALGMTTETETGPLQVGSSHFSSNRDTQ